jgi:hypothetical protein
VAASANPIQRRCSRSARMSTRAGVVCSAAEGEGAEAGAPLRAGPRRYCPPRHRTPLERNTRGFESSFWDNRLSPGRKDVVCLSLSRRAAAIAQGGSASARGGPPRATQHPARRRQTSMKDDTDAAGSMRAALCCRRAGWRWRSCWAAPACFSWA